MRGFVPDYELVSKGSLQETLNTLAQEPKVWKVFAGGTDLMVLFEAGKLNHRRFLNLAPFSELRQIQNEKYFLRIGALCTYSEIQAHPIIQKEFPLLARSGWVTGAKAIQNRGTIGGNIANASPAADTPPSLLAYGAQIELLSESRTRILDYSKFHLGYKKTALQENEIISAVRLPRGQGWTHHYYRKVGTRAFQSISKVALSMAARVENEQIMKVHLGCASIAPFPFLAVDLEKNLLHQNLTSLDSAKLSQAFSNLLAPIDDIRSTAAYRKAVTKNLVAHLVEILKTKSGIYLES